MRLEDYRQPSSIRRKFQSRSWDFRVCDRWQVGRAQLIALFQSRSWDFRVCDRWQVGRAQLIALFQSRSWDFRVCDSRSLSAIDGRVGEFQSRSWDFRVCDPLAFLDKA